MDDIHPLVLKVAGKLVPVAIGGMAADVKFLVNQLRDFEERGGWQYIMTSFFLSGRRSPDLSVRGEDYLLLCPRQV